MKRRDYVVLILLLALALIAQRLLHGSREPAGVAVISVSGAVVGKSRLDMDSIARNVGAAGPFEAICEDGAMRMVFSACEDGLCVKQGAIRMSGQSIVCLPNQVSIVLQGAADGGMDAVSH